MVNSKTVFGTKDVTDFNRLLESLGYVENETVFIRFIKGGQAFKKRFTYPLPYLPEKPLFNTYFVVNGKGESDKAICQGRAFWIEHDDLSKDEQLTLWQKLGLPKPTAQVDSGGKSIHSYWAIDSIDKTQWKELESRLIEFTKADHSIKNISRILRVPNSDYYDKQSGQKTGQTKLLMVNENRYTASDFEQILPLPEKPEKPEILYSTDELTDELTRKLIDDVVSHIPSKIDGTNTYEEYRCFFSGIKNILGLDFALSLADYLCSNSRYDWHKIIQSSNSSHNIGTIINFGKNHGFDYTQWLRENKPYPKQFTGKSEKVKEVSKEEFERIKAEKFRQELLARLREFKKFTPDKTINVRYVSDKLSDIDFDDKILAINSAKNTGKSFFYNKLARKGIDKVILIGNRCVLTFKLSKELGLEFISPDKSRDTVESTLIRATNREYYDEVGIGIVIDSLLKLEQSDYENSLVLIDEANQLIDSLCLSKTHIASIRGRVFRQLELIFKSAKKIALADADLSDHTVAVVEKMSGKKSIKVLNKYSENKRKANIYHDKESFLKTFKNQSKKKILYLSDNATELRALNDLVSKTHKSVLLTQNSLADEPNLHRFLENYGKAIRDENIDIVFISPVAQSGFSIEIDNYFDVVFADFWGIVNTDTARQFLIRDRSQCDRHIFVRDYGVGYTKNYDPLDILKTEDFKRDRQSDGLHFFADEGDDFDEAVKKSYQAITEGKDDLRKLAERITADLIAKNNIEKSDFKNILIDELKNEGYEIIELYPNDEGKIINTIEKSINQQKDNNRWSDSEKTLTAPEITDEEARELDNKPALKESDRHKLKKHRLQKSLPGLTLSSEFIYCATIKDRYRLINGVTNYLMVQNPEIARTLDYNDLAYQITQVDKHNGIFWQFDLRARVVLCEIFETLELQNLIDSQELLTSEKIKSLLKRFYWHRDKLRIFNIKFNSNSDATKILRKVVNLFGLELVNMSAKSKKASLYAIKKMTYIHRKNGLPETLDMWDEIYQAKIKYYSEVTKKQITIENLTDCVKQNQNQYQIEREREIQAIGGLDKELNIFLKAPTISSIDSESNYGHHTEKVTEISLYNEILGNKTQEKTVKTQAKKELIWSKVRLAGTNIYGEVIDVDRFDANCYEVLILKSDDPTIRIRESYPIFLNDLEVVNER